MLGEEPEGSEPEDAEEEVSPGPPVPKGESAPSRTPPARKSRTQNRDAAESPPEVLPQPAAAAAVLLLREEPAAGDLVAPPHQLDRDTADRIQTLRSGIAKALDEAREILALLESPR
jgi:hypothetical protein